MLYFEKCHRFVITSMPICKYVRLYTALLSFNSHVYMHEYAEKMCLFVPTAVHFLLFLESYIIIAVCHQLLLIIYLYLFFICTAFIREDSDLELAFVGLNSKARMPTNQRKETLIESLLLAGGIMAGYLWRYIFGTYALTLFLNNSDSWHT